MMLELVTVVVDEYDPAITFFVDVLGFTLAEDRPSTTNDGRAKRWVVVRPPGAQTGVLLARADGEAQQQVIGRQHADRVGFFLRVEDFEATLARLRGAGAEIVTAPRDEPYGRVVVFRDLAGNRWDLLGPRPHACRSPSRRRSAPHAQTRWVTYRHRCGFLGLRRRGCPGAAATPRARRAAAAGPAGWRARPARSRTW